jgi:hypothetical protein
MIVLADESVDFAVILKLRIKGIEVLSILEDSSGISDQEVLSIAVKINVY